MRSRTALAAAAHAAGKVQLRAGRNWGDLTSYSRSPMCPPSFRTTDSQREQDGSPAATTARRRQRQGELAYVSAALVQRSQGTEESRAEWGGEGEEDNWKSLCLGHLTLDRASPGLPYLCTLKSQEKLHVLKMLHNCIFKSLTAYLNVGASSVQQREQHTCWCLCPRSGDSERCGPSRIWHVLGKSGPHHQQQREPKSTTPVTRVPRAAATWVFLPIAWRLSQPPLLVTPPASAPSPEHGQYRPLRYRVADWIGGLMEVFYVLSLFLKAGSFPLLYIPAQHWQAWKRQRRGDRQPVSAAQTPTEASVKARALATANVSAGTHPRARVESTGGTALHYCQGTLPPAWQAFATGNWKSKDKQERTSPTCLCRR